jgi:hypothetical protein
MEGVRIRPPAALARRLSAFSGHITYERHNLKNDVLASDPVGWLFGTHVILFASTSTAIAASATNERIRPTNRLSMPESFPRIATA